MNRSIRVSLVITLSVTILAALVTTAVESRNVPTRETRSVSPVEQEPLTVLFPEQPEPLTESFNPEAVNANAIEFWRERAPGADPEDQYGGVSPDIEYAMTWLHPHRQHLSSLPFAKRAQSSLLDAISAEKRSSTLNEVIRRLMAMQGQGFYGGRATRMRFGAGKRK